MAAVAAACGISDSCAIEHQADVDALAKRINVLGAGPTVAVVKIDGEDESRCLPPRDGVCLKRRLRAELGFETMQSADRSGVRVLDHIIVLGEGHLRQILQWYARYYKQRAGLKEEFA